VREQLLQSERDREGDDEPPERERRKFTIPPGKRTLTMAAAALQRRAVSDFLEDIDDPIAIAATGVHGAGDPLPHAAIIERAFGRHAVSGIRTQVGGDAAAAAAALGAEAYAFGDAIAFRSAPSLHTAAHEAAHVVQQRAGIAVPGGVGRVDDAWERHADAVADCVVRGASAEALLDVVTGTPAPAASPKRPASAPMVAPAPAPPATVAHPRTVQRTSSNGVTVSNMQFSPKEIKADGITTSQASVHWSGRTGGGPRLDWTLIGNAFGSAIHASTGLITPGNNTVPKDKDSVELTVKATDAVQKGAHTTGKLTMWDTKFLQAKADYPKFVAATYSVANFRPRTGGGKFDAVYAPATKKLTATVKMSFTFVDDDPAAKVKWTAASKKTYVSEFISRAQRTWSGQWQFENIRDPKSIWKKLGPVSVSIKAVEDKNPHFPVTVHKKTVTDNVDQTAFKADFSGNNTTPQNNPFPNTGPAELAALQAKTPTPIQFAANKADISAADRGRLTFLGTYLHAVRAPKFAVTITGHAQQDAAAVSAADKAKASRAARTLSQQRAAAVQAVIAARVPGAHSLRVVAKGDAGAAPGAAWDKVEIASAIAPGYLNKYPVSAHEFGHMLGIRDEYPGAGRPAGAATGHHALTKDALGQDYADAFAKAQTDSEGLMNGGTDVRPHHYVTLWQALAAATSTAAVPAPAFGEADWKFVGM
jgi:outer membrane protein OmpA-like peptidoglycan-associated protein